MAKILLSDRPIEGWAAFLSENIQALEDYKVRAVALVVLLEEPDEDGADVLTGYYGMSLQDKQIAASNIQADVTDGIIRANIQRYLEELEEEQDDQE